LRLLGLGLLIRSRLVVSSLTAATHGSQDSTGSSTVAAIARNGANCGATDGATRGATRTFTPAHGGSCLLRRWRLGNHRRVYSRRFLGPDVTIAFVTTLLCGTLTLRRIDYGLLCKHCTASKHRRAKCNDGLAPEEALHIQNAFCGNPLRTCMSCFDS
jgi:hypothetical protein